MQILTAADFDENVKEGLVFIDFYADWCGPCKMMAPVLERLAEEYAGKVKIVKVNVDNDMELARQFNVVSIPNMYLLKDGVPVGNLIGYQQPDGIRKLFDANL